MPTFLEEFLEDIFSTYPTPPHSCMQYLQNGLKCLGIHQIGCQLPSFLHLLKQNPNHRLTVKQLVQLVKHEFSLEGSNSRSMENSVYAAFIKYLREVASGRRHGLSLSSILTFVNLSLVQMKNQLWDFTFLQVFSSMRFKIPLFQQQILVFVASGCQGQQ